MQPSLSVQQMRDVDRNAIGNDPVRRSVQTFHSLDADRRLARALDLGAQARSEDRFAADAKVRVESLTPRERQVLERVVTGRQSKIIAFELGISVRTVENHRARIMGKMEAESVSHLVRMALAAGVVSCAPHPSDTGNR